MNYKIKIFSIYLNKNNQNLHKILPMTKIFLFHEGLDKGGLDKGFYGN